MNLSHISDDSSVVVIDLAPIRLNSGPLWERSRAGVFARLQAILERALPTSTASLFGPEQSRCIVTVEDLSEDQAITSCVCASYELVMGLLGRCELNDLQVSRAKWSAEKGLEQGRVPSEELFEIADKAKLQDLILPRHLRHKQNGENQPRGKPNFTSGDSGEVTAVYGYEPVWDARREAVCMYMCVPQKITSVADPSKTFGLGELPIKQRTKVELNGLLAGIEQLTVLVERGDRFLLNAPISYETLSSPLGRAEYSRICRGVLPAYRPYVVFTLTDAPIGVSMARLSEFVTMLRAFGHVIATVAPGGRNYSAYLNIGLSCIALDLSVRQKDQSRLHSDILHIAAAGQQFKLGAGLLGIREGDTAGIAHAADIRLFHGSAVGPALDEPKRMTHLSRDSVVPSAENAGEEDWF